MVALTREAGCALHLAHATMNFGVNKGRAPELLALLDDALAAGADITLDTYPYTPGCTTLVAMLPSWASEGGPEAVLARLRGRRDAPSGSATHMEVDRLGRLPRRAHRVGHHRDLRRERPGARATTSAGRSPQSAAERGEDPWATARRLLIDDRLGSTILQHVGHEENVRQIMRHRVHTGGSDGILQGDKPHPRAYGTFPQYLGRYVRELGVLSLEECVAHLTSRPAARLRLPDRGLVREGYRADLVLFDPETVAAGSTFEAPRTLPTGIPHVLIDGRFVIEDGARTDVLAGRSVRRTARPARLPQRTPCGRNWMLMRGPTERAVFGTACSQVRWQEPPITMRSPCPSGLRTGSRPPPAGPQHQIARGADGQDGDHGVLAGRRARSVSPCQATLSRPSR